MQHNLSSSSKGAGRRASYLCRLHGKRSLLPAVAAQVSFFVSSSGHDDFQAATIGNKDRLPRSQHK